MNTAKGRAGSGHNIADLQEISSLVEQASAIAHKKQYTFLAYLLNMARTEVSVLSNSAQPKD